MPATEPASPPLRASVILEKHQAVQRPAGHRSRLSAYRDALAAHAHHLRLRYKALSPLRRALVAAAGTLIALWLLVVFSSSAMTPRVRSAPSHKFRCFGPSSAPFDLSPNAFSEWHARSPTPVKFFQQPDLLDKYQQELHKHTHDDPTASSPVALTNSSEILDKTIFKFNLDTAATENAAANRERVLILTPLRDAGPYLRRYFLLLRSLTYPHDLIDLAFLVSDTSDDTLALLALELKRAQESSKPFRSAQVITKDFLIRQHSEGQVQDQDLLLSMDNLNVEQRHAFAAQAPRRKAMARARNFLLTTALQPDHSWVLWRDVDVVESPRTLLEDLTAHAASADIVVPNAWFHRYVVTGDGIEHIEGRFDYNSWQDTDQSRALLKSLPRDVVLAEGYKEYDTGREYMARMGDWRWNKDEELPLDGCGGVSVLVKADVHRSGVNFPAYPFENQAETEGFAKMASRSGYKVVGLPNYVVWHIDTEEKGNK